MSAVTVGGVRFEVNQERTDVSSIHRPDMSWSFTDAAGHEHVWFLGDKSAYNVMYRPDAQYHTPTLVSIFDGWDYWDDGERTARTHLECKQCGEHIEPGYRSDDTRQYIGGIRSCYVDGESVSREEFERRLDEAMAKIHDPS